MPKGLKETSSTVGIGFSVTESAANTFTQVSVDLNLDPLNNEVFVVQAILLDPTSPDCITGTPTQTHMSLSTTSQTAVANLSNSNCLATSVLNIETDAVSAVAFSRDSQDTPASNLEYIGIIATNDFFVQLKGTGNANAQFGSGRLFGYRARADASIYAALVQSEVLSA
jgi:hypothetical protein